MAPKLMNVCAQDALREVHLTALGVPVIVRLTGDRASELHALVVEAWRACLRGRDADVAGVSVTASLGAPADRGLGEIRGLGVDDVMEQLTSTITMRAIDQQAGSLVMLHAAGIADPISGRTVVLVGPSEAGKTTAVRILARGRAYVSDETVGVHEDGSIVPYPKPLSVRQHGGRQQISPDELGLAHPPQSCHVARLVLLDRSVEHVGSPTAEVVSPLQALASLASETSYLARLERPLHRLAAVFNDGQGVLRLRYSEAADLDPVITDLLTL